ncbi:MAG: hypothetical protein BGO78_07170 [Chloroflexi bacterium 44-23]|nr:MAG: hypothetical protein BGO78_07170 [Chloroflexi bacterium 44-23]
MPSRFRKFTKVIPSLLTAIFLAITVWIIAVTASDPTEDRVYPRSIAVEVIGLDTKLVMVNDMPNNIAVTLNAPQSVWSELLRQQSPVRAVIDLSGLGAGEHTVDLQIQVSARPVQVVSYSPKTIDVVLESFASRSVPINLIRKGDPAVGYQAKPPVLSVTNATVSGPISQVNSVKEVRATLDITQAYTNISRSLDLKALDENERVVTDVTITPAQVTVEQEITQRYGYRNVIVSVQVEGKVAEGYRMTNISVFPLAVTVFSANPSIVNDLPGYVQTEPLQLNGLKDDVDVSLQLDLPEGVSVVGDKTTVLVRVSIAAVQSSLPVANIPIEVIGLAPDLKAVLSPEMVTLILSGPLPELDRIQAGDIRVTLDLTDYKIGTYQLEPVVELMLGETVVTSVQPALIDVQIIKAPPATPAG